MSNFAPGQLAKTIGTGLLSFPVTHFTADHRFDEGAYRKHCAWMASYPLAGLFAAGGTGEFFSLTPDEVGTVVGAAVAEVGGKLPVLTGCGYGTAIATGIARDAEKRGADGLLLLPPYLVNSKQEGLAAHIEAVSGRVRHASKSRGRRLISVELRDQPAPGIGGRRIAGARSKAETVEGNRLF